MSESVLINKVTNSKISPNNIINKVGGTIGAFNRPLTCRIEYPHLTLSAFARAFKDFIHYSVYDQFTAIIFGAYNKSLQSHLQTKQNEKNGVPDYGTPLMSYTFQIDTVDDKVETSWRSSTFLPGLSRVVYKSFYIDDDMELKLVFRRLKGTINSSIFCSSEAEMFDIQLAFIDAFHGINCFRQSKMKSIAVIPDHLIFVDYFGNKIGKALSNECLAKSYIKSINMDKYFLFMNTRSIMNLQGITPNSSYYGGTGFPEYNLTASMNFEIEIPQYVMCLTKLNYTGIEINMDIDYTYEDEKIINALHNIFGEHALDTTLTGEEYDKNIMKFDNGNIIDKVALKVDKDNFNELDLDILFPKPRIFEYEQKDILLIILFPGGMILSSDSKDYYDYDSKDNKIIFKSSLFNIGDVIEIYIFQYYTKPS